MRFTVYIVQIVILLFSVAQTSKSQNNNSAAERDVRKLERDWLDAYERFDAKAMDSIVADDFIITFPDGTRQKKPQIMASISGPATNPAKFFTEDVTARVYGETVILTGRVVAEYRRAGGTVREQSSYTDTYVRRNNIWQVAGSHLSNAAVPKAALVSSSISAQPALTDNWTGGFWIDGSWVWVNVRFDRKSETPGGTADLLFPSFGGGENAINAPLRNLKQSSDALHFEVPGRTQKVVFDGQQRDHTISGTFAYGAKTGTFGLTRVAFVTVESLEKYYGIYRASPDREISIFRGWGTPRTLNYVDYKTGHVGTLWPSSETEFFSGDGLAVSFPVALTVSFELDQAGNVDGLLWETKRESKLIAKKVEIREERLTFKNGDITVGGTLILPVRKGRHPVVIVTPGDYGTNRHQLRMWAHAYVSRGIAAFIFDSRGAGESTGPVNSSSFVELADDVLAAVRTLKARDDVNPKQIGLFGFSNSAFTVSLAASRSKDVAFLILQSFVGVLPWKQENFRAETQLRVDGFPESDVKQGSDFMRLKYDVARTGEGWERLQAIMEKARGEKWPPYTSPPNSLERLRQVYESVMTYDPVPALEKLNIPVLAIWGDKDTFLPVPETVAVFKRAMAKAGNRNYTVKVIPNSNHSLLDTNSGSPSTGGKEKHFSAGLWKLKTDWVLKRVNIVE